MKIKISYPITVSLLRQYPEEITKFFVNKKSRNGVFMGVSLLEGSFLCDEPAEMISSLKAGEILSLERINESKNHASQLSVSCFDGRCIGMLPYSASIFPCKLLDLGIKVWCCFEAAELENEMLTIAVSIYCEDY